MLGLILLITGIILAFFGIGGSAIPKMKSLGQIVLITLGRTGIVLILVGVLFLYWK
jgi:hypothetical protein